MEKVIEGYVERDLEYNYLSVGGRNVSENIDDMVSQYEGKNIKVSINIEEIETDDSDEIEYCTECGEPITDDDNIFEGMCNECGYAE